MAGLSAFADDLFPRIAPDALLCVPYAFASRYNVLPYRSDGVELYVFVADEDDDELLDRLRLASGMRVIPKRAPATALRAKITVAYAAAVPPDEGGDAAPAVRAVDEIHDSAIRLRASDIHVEPAEGGGRIRHRVDGILRETRAISQDLLAQIVSRIKLLAAMDIADKRQPQDGRYQINVQGRSIDARVSSMPTIAGEKLVIRLLDMRANVPTLEHLGMPPDILARYRGLLHAPYGFVVVCGPTGSGKTTTLYASMAERNQDGQHLCTVEDPVEVRMPGIAQVQVNERAGLTFAAALRSFLRQDPNVLMVGEMRDAETANVAVQAALSGQLVLTTLHASDGPRAVERLVELGLAPHAISAALSGIVAQRLVRRLCMKCRVPQALSENDRTFLAARYEVGAFAPRGCSGCDGTGYVGRTAIFEFLSIDDEVRSAIAAGVSSVEICEIARLRGYKPMIAQAARCVVEGLTSVGEVRRVLTSGSRE